MNINSNDSNTSKGCAGWLKGVGGVLLALLTAAASCAGILQYVDAAGSKQAQPVNSGVVVITSVPISVAQTKVSPEEWTAIEGFLSNAVNAEITAYQYGDPSYANMFYGDALQTIQTQIFDLNSKGVLVSAHFDVNNSYVHDIRLMQNKGFEVDFCEYWAHEYYNRQTGTLLSSDGWTLVPETITI